MGCNVFERSFYNLLCLIFYICFSCANVRSTADSQTSPPAKRTEIAIVGGDFYINGNPTFKGRKWNGNKIEGLLPNSRMANGIFDDLNPESAHNWKYPDTNEWDAERNTLEFVENMPLWKAHGLLSFNINLQGGSPFGYSKSQAWINSGFDKDGNLRGDYFKRLKTILDKADELGMVPNLGLFYFGQDQHLKDEVAVLKAVDNTIDWLFENNYRNILIEVANECNSKSYDHAILGPQRVLEVIDRIQKNQKNGYRFLVSVSFEGGHIPPALIVQKSDYVILHGNGVSHPDRITEMVKTVRALEGYTEKPLFFNEDDHFDFDKDDNNFISATRSHASWGLFDYRKENESFDHGFQSVPVDWGINSARKKAFFGLLKEITGV